MFPQLLQEQVVLGTALSCSVVHRRRPILSGYSRVLSVTEAFSPSYNISLNSHTFLRALLLSFLGYSSSWTSRNWIQVVLGFGCVSSGCCIHVMPWMGSRQSLSFLKMGQPLFQDTGTHSPFPYPHVPQIPPFTERIIFWAPTLCVSTVKDPEQRSCL